jgi:hypothetical protein
MRTESEIRAELEAAKAEENRQYWAFTRTARGKPVDPAVTRRICALEDELRMLPKPEPITQAVTSRKMAFEGHDSKAEAKFRASQIRYARKLGKTEAEAAELADMMCSMYGHHFRIYS